MNEEQNIERDENYALESIGWDFAKMVKEQIRREIIKTDPNGAACADDLMFYVDRAKKAVQIVMPCDVDKAYVEQWYSNTIRDYFTDLFNEEIELTFGTA